MITHVAIRFRGETHSLPNPSRHSDLIFAIADKTGARFVDGEQGFLRDGTEFLDRRAALAHALECGQVKNVVEIRAGVLFSEDVW